MMDSQSVEVVIAGGGIAGLVCALEIVSNSNKQVLIVDRDTPERIGGLARWAFGGMALCTTHEQAKANISDNPSRLLADWHRYAEFTAHDNYGMQWAEYYAKHNTEQVYYYLKNMGLTFLPAVNWVERGNVGNGNSVPRYHVLWGTGWHLVETVWHQLQPYIRQGQLTVLHQHRVEYFQPTAHGFAVEIINEHIQDNQGASTVNCFNLVIATGGINGSLEMVKRHWPKETPMPTSILNGANPISDGQLHYVTKQQGGLLHRLGDMWNYAAGIHHPQAEFEGHGLSLIPCKSALWFDYQGKRIYSKEQKIPLITGFDTNDLCSQVSQQDKPWTWQILNERIALKELAVSGSKHNPSIRDRKWMRFLSEILWGNKRLVQQLIDESNDVIAADSLDELVTQMNNTTEQPYLDKVLIEQQIKDFDQQIQSGLENDDQLRKIRHARQWRPDRLRTCKPKPLLDNNAGRLIAIKLQLITRKSLGGIVTNLNSQVIKNNQQPMANLYAIGEASGFGGGGSNGKRSLEGTFLSGCILTAQQAAKHIVEGSK
jgi:hypothetical protein